MKLSYDPEVDALRIVFRETTVTTKHLAEGIAADYDAEGRLAGLEVLDAVRRFGDKATMQRAVLEGFAESTSVLREKPDREYGERVPPGGGCRLQARKNHLASAAGKQDDSGVHHATAANGNQNISVAAALLAGLQAKEENVRGEV